MPESLDYSPDFAQTKQQVVVGKHSVYYFPLLRATEQEKPSVGQVLLSLIPFRKKGKRIQTNLIMDDERGLMVNFMIVQDSTKN